MGEWGGGGHAGFEINSSKKQICHLKFHLPPVNNVGSKKLLPGNSVLKVISWKNKLIFTAIILLFIRQTQSHLVKGIINAFDHMEFCLVINLTMCGKLAVTWPPMIATKYVNFATTLNTR